MVNEIINTLSTIIALISVIYLFITASKCSKGLRFSMILIGLGVFIALGLHSLSEALETFGYLETRILLQIMPILVLIGSLILIWGTYKLYQTINLANKGGNKNE